MSLYPPPKQITAELFTSVPEAYRFPEQESDWVKANKPGQKVHSFRLPILPNGTTSKVGVFTQLAGGVSGADGLAMDEEGNLSVCDAGNGCVWMFSKWGEPTYRIMTCSSGRTTTNLAYGGTGNKTLYFTESDTGNILSCQMNVAGKKMFGLS